MLLYHEIDDCEQCPLMKEGICPGGWSGSPNGPVEPPCTAFDDDTDLDAWMEDHYAYLARQEAYADEQRKKREARRAKNERAKRRRNYLKNYCVMERIEVKQAKEAYSAYKSSLEMARSFASAVNLTNQCFGYKERAVEKPEAAERLVELEARVKEAEEKLKAKRAEGRKTEKYQSIV